jgi:hypothetical protein
MMLGHALDALGGVQHVEKLRAVVAGNGEDVADANLAQA